MEILDLQQHCHNKLLALLDKTDLLHLAPLLVCCEVEHKAVLVRHDQPIHYIYFPSNSVYSILTSMSDGGAIEIGTVGNEGMTSLNALLGGRIATDTLVCQIPGNCVRISFEHFQWELERNSRFRLILQLYAQAYISQMAQSVACNRLHSLEQRAARWLLMTHDRVEESDFPLTQEFFAVMLGAQRPSVTAIAQKFQSIGAVSYSRGRMRILNRQILEESACECYAATRRSFERLLGVRAG